MTSDDLLEDLLLEFRDYSEEIQHYLQQKEKKNEIRRVERAHLIVAIGVASAFIGLFSSTPANFKPGACLIGRQSDLVCALGINAFFSMLYIPAKLVTITIRPLPLAEDLEDLNDLVLPFVHVMVFIGSIPLIILLLFGFNLSFKGLAPSYFIIQFLLLFIPASRYAKQYEKTMGRIEAATTNRRVLITSGFTGDAGRLILTNTTNEAIPPSEIEIQAKSVPQGIEINIGQTVDRNGHWELIDELGPNETRPLPVHTEMVPGADVKEDVIVFLIKVADEKPLEKTLRIGS